ncbi:MAG: NAD(P)/FAD-dependent oxidoreductase, partial [Candidatus Cloacimonadaceae bacterium]|nr:NAD(P)/FAD-dependent oxidoreductase [Candidatus Cloacimonadaceae bacterium]
MKMNFDAVIIGAGPSGICAANVLGMTGKKVLLMERDPFLGGQLLKQSHMFFGSRQQYAGTRGFEIAGILQEELASYSNVTVFTDTIVAGYYPEENILLALKNENQLLQIAFKQLIVATGASEKSLLFTNTDLPGIFGAGAVQTLMNMYGVLPGKSVVMVGSGNIGLIVSYQLMQAGAEVKCVIDAAPSIGGYFVHAAKIRRMGVPILMQHTIHRAIGSKSLEAVEIMQVDSSWKKIPGTEKIQECDVLCLAVGLMPMTELLWQMGCKMRYVPELGGSVPWRNSNLETTSTGVFVAGDVAGVEEASSAM